MNLTDRLNIEGINIEQLQKGLKHIGLNVSKFDSAQEDQIPGLIELFKIAVKMDPKTTTKFNKMDLRSKLEKVLRGQQVSTHSNSAATSETSEKNVVSKEQFKPVHPNLKPKRQPVVFPANKILGKVKFFDVTKGFGFISNYYLTIDYFVHIKNCLCEVLYENEILIFETRNSERKADQIEAVGVSNKIPVFIFNKESFTHSFVYPLIEPGLEKEIALTERLATGFFKINASNASSSWKAMLIPSEAIQNAETISFSRKLLLKLFSDSKEYKKPIKWLTEFLQTQLNETDLNSLYADAGNDFEQKSIAEINKEIKDIIEVSFFQSFLEEKKNTLNKISFVLWGQSLISKLPTNNSELERDFWNNEIFPTLDRVRLRNVFEELYKEEGATIRVNGIFSYILNQQLIINTNDELENLISFLDPLISVFPSNTLAEANFTCKYNQYYIRLYDKGLIKDLSEVRIRKHIDDLKTDDEKARFIERLPPEKILTFYSTYPSLINYQGQFISSIIENEFSKIDFLCFDLESDGEKIKEFAWKGKAGAKSEKDFRKQDEGISELVSLLNSGILIIGQNIKEFDLSILAKRGASSSFDLVWDTLEVEMLLNPQRFSYGLKAQHSAAADTELTYRLFKNQLSRMIASASDYAAVKDILPLKAIEAIDQITSNSNWILLDHQYFEKQSHEFYRPNPINQSISEQTFIQLKEKINEDGHKVIVAPEFLWNTLSRHIDLFFIRIVKR